ncbi:MAG: alpha/beta hydrolase [Streptococcaceae bacterium]|jgi:non-heme chloroperoxidase|nr:alpha/beta hydrolase [Streptococcaceae bacterium]
MSKFITNDGVSISFHEYGMKSGQAVVFVNGYSASEATWLVQMGSFAKSGFHVITYDHRSHGHSDKVDYGLTVQRLALDLRELTENLRLEQPVFIGHSMGATVLFAYEQMFTDKELLALVTEDQAPCFLRNPDWLDGQGLDFAGLEKFMNDFPEMHLTKKALPDELKRELGESLLAFDFQLGRPLLQNILTQDFRTTLVQEAVPHLFLAGSGSPTSPTAHAKAALALTHNSLSQAEIFEGCGHLLHLEDAEKFDAVVKHFIERVKK